MEIIEITKKQTITIQPKITIEFTFEEVKLLYQLIKLVKGKLPATQILYEDFCCLLEDMEIENGFDS